MDIEEIKSRYAELYEDEVLIEKQKNKLVKELKELIKKENISSKEDEEKNEEILILKEKIIEINNVLTNLEKEKEAFFEQQSTEVKELLKELGKELKRKYKEKMIDKCYLDFINNLKL